MVVAVCRLASAGVAQCLRTLAPTIPPDRPYTPPIERVFDWPRTARKCGVARSCHFFGRRQGDHQMRRSDQVSRGSVTAA